MHLRNLPIIPEEDDSPLGKRSQSLSNRLIFRAGQWHDLGALQRRRAGVSIPHGAVRFCALAIVQPGAFGEELLYRDNCKR